MASTCAERSTRSLTCCVPIVDTLLGQICLSVMMRQQFGLCLSHLRKLGFQDVSNTLVIVLPRTLEE